MTKAQYETVQQRARKQKYRLRQTTSHSSLLVARQDGVSVDSTKSFSRLTRSSPTNVVVKRSNLYIIFQINQSINQGLLSIQTNNNNNIHTFVYMNTERAGNEVKLLI